MGASIFASQSSSSIANRLSQALGTDLRIFDSKLFPDGDSYVRLTERPSTSEVILVNTLYPNQDKKIIETLLMCDALGRGGVKRITLVSPYLAYTRQDRVFLEGEAISPRAIGLALKSAGISRIISVETHSHEAVEALEIQVTDVKATRPMVEAITKLPKPVKYIVAPDFKALRFADEVAKNLNLETFVFSKQRDRTTGEVSSELVKGHALNGEPVCIVDDMISTGGSIANASIKLKEIGAGPIFAVCVHALMVDGASAILRRSGVEEVWGSDTVENEFTRYSITDELVTAIHGP